MQKYRSQKKRLGAQKLDSRQLSVMGKKHASKIKALCHPAYMVRRDAAYAAGTLKGKAVIHSLLPLLDDRYSEVRRAAAESLGCLKAKEAVQKLIGCLYDSDELVRVCASESLGYIGDRRAIRPLLKVVVGDKSGLVRSYCASALGELRDRRVLRTLRLRERVDRSPTAKIGIYQALYKLGNHNVLQKLIAMLQSRSYRTRCAVANVLGEIVSVINAAQIKKALKQSLSVEMTRAARSSIKKSLALIKKDRVRS